MERVFVGPLEEIGPQIDLGKVRPFVEATFPLAEARAARLETTHSR